MYENKQQQKMKFRCVGAGFCGTVWVPFEHGSAFKREEGWPVRSLLNDFEMHKRALSSFHQLPNPKPDRQDTMHPQIQIPQCHRLIHPDDEWWKENLSSFPEGFFPCYTINCQRIPPFPEVSRKFLVDKYCPPEISHEILMRSANRDCLVRPYLGRQRRPPKFKELFSLRNYPLHVGQMEEIGIPPDDMQSYARTMAEALATLHWIGEMDGNDVKFVLAPPASEEHSSPNKTTTMSNVLGEHTMWMFDFDLCRSMPMNETGVRQAVAAFWRNDPFYPRPDTESNRLFIWITFREQYLHTTEECAGVTFRSDILQYEKRLHLSRLFIQLLEEQCTFTKAKLSQGAAPEEKNDGDTSPTLRISVTQNLTRARVKGKTSVFSRKRMVRNQKIY